ncbi:MAG: hypothetical protein GY827_03265 [Cytophagales bacterium]|nr:hypothetical protein [Cytophagales bacterium]
MNKNTDILKVALRQGAIYVPNVNKVQQMNEQSTTLLAHCQKLGFTFDEDLLHALNGISPHYHLLILDMLEEVMGVKKNWTPLIKNWKIPTNESISDHFKTFFTNLFGLQSVTKGNTLACGHFIPSDSFQLDRYNGCPYCGTPFEAEKLELSSEKRDDSKVLKLWGEAEVAHYFNSLLASPVALDGTQVDSLKMLLKHYDLPQGVNIVMKETMMLVIDILVEHEQWEKANACFGSPQDILRYLWYKHTSYLRIVEPTVLKRRITKNASMNYGYISDNKRQDNLNNALNELKLKFGRKACRMYAQWLNNLDMPVQKQCEMMHPKREIWVRVIRALRLAEYSKKQGFENLAVLMDTFYHKKYDVWQAKYEQARLSYDSKETFALLKERPSVFARSLFANVLWFGAETTLNHFQEVASSIPPRLLFTLNMYAEPYFEKEGMRSVQPLGGINKAIPKHKLLSMYSEKDVKKTQDLLKKLTLETMEYHYMQEETNVKRAYISPDLFKIPLAIGDRAETVQDSFSTLMGTKFPVEGSSVRLFMQWGEGLKAQHLDMDLSCRVVYGTNNVQHCSYSRLTIAGCQHSGDIQSIPEKIGTAEYIDIDIDVLQKKKAKQVIFTCNAFTSGSLSPNLVVGWMNSKYPMKITNKGVAYNPADVQHQVRIQQSVTKGLVFGVLDVEAKEIMWLEMPFDGQLTQNLNTGTLDAYFKKLENKIKVGDVVKIKCDAQNIHLVDTPEKAEFCYDNDWLPNVNSLLE